MREPGMRDDGIGAGGDEIGVAAWFGLGTSTVGARLVGAARVAAILHEDALRRAAGEGVGVEERLMLLDGAGMGDAA